MIRRPPRSTLDRSSAASDVYKRQVIDAVRIVIGIHNGDQRNAELSGLCDRNLVVADICLLYTSPSPRDRTRSRMPSSACKKKTPLLHNNNVIQTSTTQYITLTNYKHRETINIIEVKKPMM